MIGAQFDKKGLKSELRNFILDKDKYNGEYVCKVDVGYSVVYPEDKLLESIVFYRIVLRNHTFTILSDSF